RLPAGQPADSRRGLSMTPANGTGGSIAVLGAGSWGTALAIQLARGGRRVLLWGRDRDAQAAMQDARENARYLPGCRFPGSLEVTASLAEAVGADDQLAVVPSHALRELLGAMRDAGWNPRRLAWATKGLEPDTALL